MPLNIWAVWPTVHLKQSEEMALKWQDLGYKTAILVNTIYPRPKNVEISLYHKKWEGFAHAANALCQTVVEEGHADIVVVVGDDLFPETMYDAETIGQRFLADFSDLYGVMQPTGDKFESTHRCAVSPWVGRKFIQKSYQGKGPYCPRYFHYFADEELQLVATKQNCFKQYDDITQFHDHWQRVEPQVRPTHLLKAGEKWDSDHATFLTRQKQNFPGSERKK